MTVSARPFRLFCGILTLALVAGSASCSKSPAAPDVNVDATDLVVGTGLAINAGNIISVSYTGWLRAIGQLDNKGALFSTNVGGTPLVFIVGSGQVLNTGGGVVIDGLNIGVVGMQVGGSRRLVIPPALAYGSVDTPDGGGGIIPANSYVIYDVTLLTAQ